MDMFPGIQAPTTADRLGAELADEQLKLILGLREVRLERGLSVQEVARDMKVDASQVSRFESGGTNPTMSTIRRYAKAVDAMFRVDVCSRQKDQSRRIAERAAKVDVIWDHPAKVEMRTRVKLFAKAPSA